MNDYLTQLRLDIEILWDESTCSKKFLPINPDNPAAGQCAPTSYVVLQKLRERFPKKRFSHAVGCVFVDGEVAIDYHLWVVEIDDEKSRVIDITGDQCRVLPKVINETIYSLAKQKITYLAFETSENSSMLNHNARELSEVLMDRYKRKYRG